MTPRALSAEEVLADVGSVPGQHPGVCDVRAVEAEARLGKALRRYGVEAAPDAALCVDAHALGVVRRDGARGRLGVEADAGARSLGATSTRAPSSASTSVLSKIVNAMSGRPSMFRECRVSGREIQ